MSARKEELEQASRSLGERQDCTVRALAAATGVEYRRAWMAMAYQGRKPRSASSIGSMIVAAWELGFHMARLRRRGQYPDGWYVGDYTAKTVRTAARDRQLREGTFVLSVSRHVAALVDGEVMDWADGRLNRLRAVYRVTALEPDIIDDETEEKTRRAPTSQMWLF